MPFSILNNIAGINAQNQSTINSVNLNRTLLRLSSGKRINSGADDAAGLGIAASLRANVRALDQAIRNANDGISVAQIADGALQEISNLLTRGFSLAEEAATDTVDDTNGRAALNAELTSIKDEIGRIATRTNFNGVRHFNDTATAMNVFVGDIYNDSSITVTLGAVGATVGGQDLAATTLATQAGAVTAMGNLKTALQGINSNRATLRAAMNRLQCAVSVLMTQSQNTTAAESTIRDANMAGEIANLTKYQILAQSGSHSVLALFK